MDPLQQTPQNNPYEFITNPDQPSKKPAFGGSTKSRIILVSLGIVLLIIIATVISTVMGSAGRASVESLKNISAQQTEIIRVAELGNEGAISSETRAYISTISLTVTTSQQEVGERLTANKAKMSKVETASKLNSKTDESLNVAKANNRYDEELIATMNKELEKYMTSLKSAYDSNSSEKTRTALEKAYNNAGTLLATSPKTAN